MKNDEEIEAYRNEVDRRQSERRTDKDRRQVFDHKRSCLLSSDNLLIAAVLVVIGYIFAIIGD